jgi:hypothetical protein
MDRRDVSALAEELAQLTCEHLPWSDQRVIAIARTDAAQLRVYVNRLRCA